MFWMAWMRYYTLSAVDISRVALPDVTFLHHEMKMECVVSATDGCPQLASGGSDHKVREVIEYQWSAPFRLSKGEEIMPSNTFSSNLI